MFIKKDGADRDCSTMKRGRRQAASGAPTSCESLKHGIHLAVRAQHGHRDVRPMLVDPVYEKRTVSLFEIPDVRQEIPVRPRFRATLGHLRTDGSVVSKDTFKQPKKSDVSWNPNPQDQFGSWKPDIKRRCAAAVHYPAFALGQSGDYVSLSCPVALYPARKPTHVSVQRLKFKFKASCNLRGKRRFATA